MALTRPALHSNNPLYERLPVNIPKRQHYLPQFYLNHFGVRKQKTYRIFVYDLDESRVYPTSVDKTAKEKGYYDVKIGGGFVATAEKALSEFEDKVAPVYKNLVRHMNPFLLNQEDRGILSLFFATMISRVPRSRETSEQLEKIVKSEFAEKGIRYYDDIPFTGERKKHFDIDMIRLSADQFAPVIYSMNWRLGLVAQGLMLITSDCPLVMCNPVNNGLQSNIGLKVSGIQLCFPLTPCLLLIMYHPTDYDLPETAFTLNFDSVVLQNHLEAYYATRYLYSMNLDYDLDPTVRNNREVLSGGAGQSFV